MSTDLASVGVASLEWRVGQPASLEIHKVSRSLPLFELLLTALSDPHSNVAVDVPFGWPEGFAQFLASHSSGPAVLPKPVGQSAWSALASRETDRQVRTALGIQGLSVSFDKLGATAAMWSDIESRLLELEGHRLDRSGMTGRIVETWPRAAWVRFVGRDENPAKLSREQFVEVLSGVVDFSADSWHQYSEARREHAQDATCAHWWREPEGCSEQSSH